MTNMDDMFVSSMFEGTNYFNKNIGSWDTSKVTKMDKMFFFARAFDQNILT